MVAPEEYFDFKFVIDNIDKNIKPSLEHLNSKGHSMHYVHRYHIAQNFDRGNFDVFDVFQLDRQNLTCQIG